MVSTKERHILFINGKNDWSYFLTEINFNINFPKKKKKFLRNILIWIIKKILFKLNFLCIFWVQKKK